MRFQLPEIVSDARVADCNWTRSQNDLVRKRQGTLFSKQLGNLKFK